MKLAVCHKSIFLKENIFSGQTHSPESNFDNKKNRITLNEPLFLR